MATNQENIIATAQTALSLTGLNYNQAIMELAKDAGVTNANFNGAFIEYLQIKLTSSKTNINDLLAEYSATNFDGNINSINDFTL